MKACKTTKRALLMSCISLLLCVSMLVGTTFAWFTDTAATGLNQIIAGNLDVALLDKTGESVEGDTELFTMPELWEPGAVAFAQVQVANEGNLDLKASLSISYEDVNSLNGHTLSEVLKYAIIDATDVDLTSRAAVLAAAKASANKGALSIYDFDIELEPGEKSDLQTLVIYWEPNGDNADNLYNANNGQQTSNGDPLQINLGVKVFATQLGGNANNESDSFGTDYDADAYSSVYEAGRELALKGKNMELSIPGSAELLADGKPVPDGTELVAVVTEEEPTHNEVAVGYISEVYNIDLETRSGDDIDATGAFDVQLQIGKGRRAIRVFQNGEEINGSAYDAETGILTVTALSNADEGVHFVVEEYTFEPDTTWYDGNEEATEYILDTAAELLGFATLVDGGNTFAGKTVKLGADIDLKYAEWEAIGSKDHPFSGSFDGQGHTISNLKITKEVGNIAASNRQGLFSTIKPVGATTFSNLKVHNVDVTGGYHVGGVIATSDGSNQSATGNYLVVTNIEMTGLINVSGWEGVAGVMGSGNMAEISNITINAEPGSEVTTMPDGRTNSFACVGSVKGGGYLAKIDNITSNLNVTAKTAGTGGLFGVVGGQNVECYVSNLFYSGTVKLTETSTGLQWNYGCYCYNGLLIGSARFSLIADQDTCSSTGSLELHTEEGIMTSNDMGEAFTWGEDLFGGSRDNAYTNKSYAKSYTG